MRKTLRAHWLDLAIAVPTSPDVLMPHLTDPRPSPEDVRGREIYTEVHMSKSQKLLIGGGAVIIVAVMTIGAFSMGIYVGERGGTATPPSITDAGKQPVAPKEPLPKGKPDLNGAVQSVARRRVTIRTTEGPRLVLVSDQTQVRWHDDRRASLADLKRNTAIAVFGDFGNDGRTLTASVIVILPPKT
jgi:hypothetical protein